MAEDLGGGGGGGGRRESESQSWRWGVCARACDPSAVGGWAGKGGFFSPAESRDKELRWGGGDICAGGEPDWGRGGQSLVAEVGGNAPFRARFLLPCTEVQGGKGGGVLAGVH